MVENEYTDITPAGMEKAPGKGAKGAKHIVFQETEKDIITNNPGRLTKEGIEKKIENYRRSNNSVALTMYKAMLNNCKSIRPSKTVKKQCPDQDWRDDSGKGRRAPMIEYECQVLSYDKKGLPFWVEPIKKIENKKEKGE